MRLDVPFPPGQCLAQTGPVLDVFHEVVGVLGLQFCDAETRREVPEDLLAGCGGPTSVCRTFRADLYVERSGKRGVLWTLKYSERGEI